MSESADIGAQIEKLKAAPEIAASIERGKVEAQVRRMQIGYAAALDALASGEISQTDVAAYAAHAVSAIEQGEREARERFIAINDDLDRKGVSAKDRWEIITATLDGHGTARH